MSERASFDECHHSLRLTAVVWTAAARTKLKTLQKEAAAKAQSAANDLASKGPKERSPHAKEVRTTPMNDESCWPATARAAYAL